MTNNTYSIQPILPPRLDSSPEQYQAYLSSYQLYVEKVQEVRERAKEAASRKTKPAPKEPERKLPALSEKTREKIGKAYTSGYKFGTLRFSAEELAAARKRWQTLHDRGRTRAALPLNKKERSEFKEAKDLASRYKQKQNELGFHEIYLTPFLRKVEADLAVKVKLPAPLSSKLGDLTAEDVSRGKHLDGLEASERRLKNVKKGLETICDLANNAVSDQQLIATRKAEAEIQLKLQEVKLRAAQTATQLNRASLKHTVNRTTKSHVVSSENNDPFVVVVPEVSETTESLLETGRASHVQTNKLAEPSRVSVISLGVSTPSQPNVATVTL